MKVAGYDQRPDYTRMGPSLLIASALIMAIRTARWPAALDENLVSPELDQEIDYAVLLGHAYPFAVAQAEGVHVSIA